MATIKKKKCIVRHSTSEKIDLSITIDLNQKSKQKKSMIF